MHLVRDPRAMYSSLWRKPDVWKEVLEDFKSQCSRIENDMKLEEELPKHREADKINTG